MSKDEPVPEIGQIVLITKGRESNQYAVVINVINDRYVLLADGEKRKYDRPKKKQVNHIELTPFISDEIKKSLLETNRVSNGKLRFALTKHANEGVTYIVKGDGNDV